METKLSRRKMLQNSARIALGGTFILNSPFNILRRNQEKRSKVILIRDENLIDSAGNINQQVLSGMIDEAVVNLTHAKSQKDAWKVIIKPGDVVGIKSNHRDQLPTPPELENILKLK